MGAYFNDFTVAACSTDELKAKFRDAQRQATIVHGTDPYNGTISTVSGLRIDVPPRTRDMRVCPECDGVSWYTGYDPNKGGDYRGCNTRDCDVQMPDAKWRALDRPTFDEAFPDIDAARAYALEAAQKWENAVAVKVEDDDADAGWKWYVGAWCAS